MWCWGRLIAKDASLPPIVSVVLEEDFGEDLSMVYSAGPVWIIDSAANRAVVEKIWKLKPGRPYPDVITIFNTLGVTDRELIFLDVFGTIDLHHGEHSSDPPYGELRVIGTPVTEAIRAELYSYGFDNYGTYPNGFSVKRNGSSAFITQ